MPFYSRKIGRKGLLRVLEVVKVNGLTIRFRVSPSMLEEFKKISAVVRIAVLYLYLPFSLA